MHDVVPSLNLHAWLERSVVNGPGTRFVLWVQGCPLACPGCFSPDTHAFDQRHVIHVAEMADRICAVNGLEGVTYSGGEPMTQAYALASLSERLTSVGLTIVCYTGYTIETLRKRRDPWIEKLLSRVDILIDGPYIREKAVNRPWCGSSNQRVHFLTDAYKHRAEQMQEQTANVEFTVGKKHFLTSGTWPEGFLQRLEELLKR